MRLVATFPKRSNCDARHLRLEKPGDDYPMIRRSAAQMLRDGHTLDVISANFSRLFVDEYQDCSVPQHAIVYYMAKALPTCVLGDPMQAIFDFGEPLASWKDHVCKHFPLVGELDTPWRWKNVNEEGLGHWLLSARQSLLHGDPLDLKEACKSVSWVALDGKNDHKAKLTACNTQAPNKDGTVLIVGDSKNRAEHRQFASQTYGAVVVENVDLTDLVSFAKNFELDAPDALSDLLGFAEEVMTNVGAGDILGRVNTLRANRGRKPATQLEQSALSFHASRTYDGAREILALIGQQGGVRTHRPAILRGCLSALQAVGGDKSKSFYEAAVAVREQSRVLGRPLPKRAIGSTLLLKGLEADVCVLLNGAGLNRRNLYVAMTRAARRLVICSRESVLSPRQ